MNSRTCSVPQPIRRLLPNSVTSRELLRSLSHTPVPGCSSVSELQNRWALREELAAPAETKNTSKRPTDISSSNPTREERLPHLEFRMEAGKKGDLHEASMPWAQTRSEPEAAL